MTSGVTETGAGKRTPDFISRWGRPRAVIPVANFGVGHEPEESRYPAARRDLGGGVDESEHGCVSGG